MKKILLALFLLGIVGAGLAYWQRAKVKDYLRYARDRVYGSQQAQAKGCAQTPEPSRPSPVKTSPLPAITTPKHFDQCASYAHVFDIPVTVNSERAQKPPLTKFLLPFSRESLVFSLNGFVVKDESGKILPAQFETLARYAAHPGDCAAPVRYAYAHVLAAPEGKAVWRVVHEPQKSLTGSTLQIDANTVSTQVAEFSLGAKGVQKVQMGGRVISEVKGDGGFMVEAPTLLALSKPWRMEWERRGPYVATFVIRGFYGQRQLGLRRKSI